MIVKFSVYVDIDPEAVRLDAPAEDPLHDWPDEKAAQIFADQLDLDALHYYTVARGKARIAQYAVGFQWWREGKPVTLRQPL